MGNLAIDSTLVVPSHKNFLRATAGGRIAAGDLIYKDSTGAMQLSDAHGVEAAQVVDGLAVNSAAVGQPVDYASEDAALSVGAAVTAGAPYFLSATPGKMGPFEDLATGGTTRSIFLGNALAANKFNFKPVARASFRRDAAAAIFDRTLNAQRSIVPIAPWTSRKASNLNVQ